jgi:copper chaperone NosL
MNMKIERSARALEMPLSAGPRILLVAAIALVIVSYAIPLWNLSAWGGDGGGSRVSVYTYTIGIHSYGDGSDPAAAAARAAWAGVEPSGWIAIGLAAMALLFLRAAFLGTTRSLIDAFVLYVFFAAASVWSFSLQLFRLARHLAPAESGNGSMTGVLFGQSRIGGIDFVGSPGAGAWTLVAVGVLLATALLVAWTGARKEMSSDCLVAG